MDDPILRIPPVIGPMHVNGLTLRLQRKKNDPVEEGDKDKALTWLSDTGKDQFESQVSS